MALRPRITSGLPLSEDQLHIIGCESFAVNPLQVFGSRSFQVASPDVRTAVAGDAQHTLEQGGEVKPIISDLQGRNRIEYNTYKTLKEGVLSRYLESLPYVSRWNEFRKHHASLVKPTPQIFVEIRASGRIVRPRVIAMLDGTGIDVDTLLRALSNVKLLTVRRGRSGGMYYPTQ